MIRISFFVLMVILLSACRSAPPPISTPSENIVVEPSATRTVIPSPTPPTPTLVFPTLPPTPTIDPGFFRDDFIETLDTQWSWVREDPKNWSLAVLPGSLQINAAEGYVLAHSNSNLLVRPAPAGNFQIEAQITFSPKNNFDFAGLIIYESDSNFIQAGLGFCSSIGCIGKGLYTDNYRRGLEVEPSFGQAYTRQDPIFLRLSRREDTYRFETSKDRQVWFLIGNHTSNLKPHQVGLVAGQNLSGGRLPAIFDYFEVRSLP